MKDVFELLSKEQKNDLPLIVRIANYLFVVVCVVLIIASMLIR